MTAALKIDPAKLLEPPFKPTRAVKAEEKPDWGRIAHLREERLKYEAEDAPVRMRLTWSKSQDETFRRMYAGGAGYDEIGAAVGKTRTTVRRYAAKLVKHGQLKARPKATTPTGAKLWTPQEMFTVRKMLAEGASIAEVAEKLGRTPEGIRKKLYKMRGKK